MKEAYVSCVLVAAPSSQCLHVSSASSTSPSTNKRKHFHIGRPSSSSSVLGSPYDTDLPSHSAHFRSAEDPTPIRPPRNPARKYSYGRRPATSAGPDSRDRPHVLHRSRSSSLVLRQQAQLSMSPTSPSRGFGPVLSVRV